MPTYEYTCAKCGHTMEKYQSIKDPTLTVCPKELCPRKTWGKGKIKRAVGGGAGLIFKGSGFYITDYRSEGYKAAAKKDSSAGSSASASDAAKKSKPETKAESKPSGTSTSTTPKT